MCNLIFYNIQRHLVKFLCLILVGCGDLPDEGTLRRQGTSVTINYNHSDVLRDIELTRYSSAVRSMVENTWPVRHNIKVEPDIADIDLDENLSAEVEVPVDTYMTVDYKNWTLDEPEIYYEYGSSDPFIVTHASPDTVTISISVDINPDYPMHEDDPDNETTECTENCTVDNETIDNETETVDLTLLAHYEFEGNLEDSSSYERHLELCSGSNQFIFVDETVMNVLPSNKAAYFQGTECAENEFRNDNDTKPLDTEADFTISFWILPWLSNTDFDTYHSVMSTGDATSGWKFQIDHDQGYLRFAGKILQLMEENWMMFTYTKMTGVSGSSDNKKVRVYVDGELKSSIYPIWSDFDKLKIGMNRLGGGGWYGLIDDVRIYNRAFTEDEIEELYESYD